MRRWLPVLAVAAGVSLLWVWRSPPPEAPGPGHTDRPWQVQSLPDGSIRALGLVPGKSTLGEAIGRFGKGLEAAIFDSPGRETVIEAYWSEAVSGGITGRLVVRLAPSPEVLEGLRARSPRPARTETGTVRYEIHPQDAEVVASLPIRLVTLAPTASLDEDLVRARFGEPEERLAGGAGVSHWLYPARGIAVTLTEQGRELIDYVDPRDFTWLRDTLERSAQADRR
jgi:hypothetical protein